MNADTDPGQQSHGITGVLTDCFGHAGAVGITETDNRRATFGSRFQAALRVIAIGGTGLKIMFGIENDFPSPAATPGNGIADHGQVLFL